MRTGYENPLLRGGRLLQQYVVDTYVKIESQKLRWVRSHQKEIRSEIYQGLRDSLISGENNAGTYEILFSHKTVKIEIYVGFFSKKIIIIERKCNLYSQLLR